MITEQEITEQDRIKFNILHQEYIKLVTSGKWEREWLQESPLTELAVHLMDPIGNRKARLLEWDLYVMSRAENWWKERGWQITFGKPNEGCWFNKLE
jgi:hypothetical protein